MDLICPFVRRVATTSSNTLRTARVINTTTTRYQGKYHGYFSFILECVHPEKMSPAAALLGVGVVFWSRFVVIVNHRSSSINKQPPHCGPGALNQAYLGLLQAPVHCL